MLRVNHNNIIQTFYEQPEDDKASQKIPAHQVDHKIAFFMKVNSSKNISLVKLV